MFDLQRKPLTRTRTTWLLSLPALLLVGLVIAAPASAARPVNALRHGDIAPADAFRAAYAPDAIAAARTPLDRPRCPPACVAWCRWPNTGASATTSSAR